MYIFSSLLGVKQGSKKAWATPRSISFKGLIQNFRRASESNPPPPPGHESHMALDDVMYLPLVSSTAMTSVMRILVVLPCWLVSPVTSIFIRSTIQSHIYFFHTVTSFPKPFLTLNWLLIN